MVNRTELYDWVKENGEFIGTLSNHGNEFASKIRGVYNEYIHPDPTDDIGWVLLNEAVKELRYRLCRIYHLMRTKDFICVECENALTNYRVTVDKTELKLECLTPNCENFFWVAIRKPEPELILV